MTKAPSKNEADGINLTIGAEIAPTLIANRWLSDWEGIGGSISIGPGGRFLKTWITFGADRAAPGICANLMDELLDTPGLPRAIKHVIARRIRSR